jgi:16S rRNA (cytosine967-C5)-methyltransferase
VAQVSPARATAFAVVRRVFEQDAYADRALAAEADGLDQRDRALAMQIAYGTVQRRLTLDHLAEGLMRRPRDSLDPPVLAGLRVGLFQLLYLDGIPAHAAVDETVELVKRESAGGAGFVNAVLRRAAGERDRLLATLSDQTAPQAAVAHSVPEWLPEMWWEELGPARARALLRHINRPAETAIRVNTLVTSAEEMLRDLPVPARRVSELPEALILDGRLDLAGSRLFASGALTPQARASMLVGRILAPSPGDRVIDLCAAPGVKATHLAALMQDQGSVLAVERHPGRARELSQTCRRMRASCIQIEVQDALELGIESRFDRTLLDPPCSGLGTLQSRPDRRWRASAEAIPELAELQARLLRIAARATRPGGCLVYSVCTVSDREGPQVIDAFLREAGEWRADPLGSRHPAWQHPSRPDYLQLMPDRDGTDGFFIARLSRALSRMGDGGCAR